MIGRIKGILIEKEPPILLVDVSGVGYEINASMHSFYRLPNLGSEVVLYTSLVTREDSQTLYGFVTKEERTLFQALIKVSGIGPKTALAILSSIEPQEFVRCVLDDDLSGLVKLPGIGKKTAQRLLIEMRDKISALAAEGLLASDIAVLPATKEEKGESGNLQEVEKTITANEGQTRALKEAVSALVSLGYNLQVARNAVLQHRNKNLSREEIIRLSLKALAGQ